jgi:hypothetical protein
VVLFEDECAAAEEEALGYEEEDEGDVGIEAMAR